MTVGDARRVGVERPPDERGRPGRGQRREDPEVVGGHIGPGGVRREEAADDLSVQGDIELRNPVDVGGCCPVVIVESPARKAEDPFDELQLERRVDIAERRPVGERPRVAKVVYGNLVELRRVHPLVAGANSEGVLAGRNETGANGLAKRVGDEHVQEPVGGIPLEGEEEAESRVLRVVVARIGLGDVGTTQAIAIREDDARADTVAAGIGDDLAVDQQLHVTHLAPRTDIEGPAGHHVLVEGHRHRRLADRARGEAGGDGAGGRRRDDLGGTRGGDRFAAGERSPVQREVYEPERRQVRGVIDDRDQPHAKHVGGTLFVKGAGGDGVRAVFEVRRVDVGHKPGVQRVGNVREEREHVRAREPVDGAGRQAAPGSRDDLAVHQDIDVIDQPGIVGSPSEDGEGAADNPLGIRRRIEIPERSLVRPGGIDQHRDSGHVEDARGPGLRHLDRNDVRAEREAPRIERRREAGVPRGAQGIGGELRDHVGPRDVHHRAVSQGPVHPELDLVDSREVEHPPGDRDDAGNGLAGRRPLQHPERSRERRARGQPGAEGQSGQ